MKVIVRIRSKLQGEWVFWQGHESEISEIPCTRAKELAKSAVRTKKPKAFGIWHVSVEENTTNNTGDKNHGNKETSK